MPMLEQMSPENRFLNSTFTSSELLQGIRQLRCGKSPGIDKIMNGMIKSSPQILSKPIMHLFNIGGWKHYHTYGLQVLLFYYTKMDPEVTRTTTGELKCQAVWVSLWLKFWILDAENHLWTQNQTGFRKGHRTEDNIFILHTIYQKCIHENNKIVLAVIDFQMFFYTINRMYMYLFYKFLNHKITENFYYCLKSYPKCEHCVKSDGGLTQACQSLCGVKQGCNLSPTLANI